MLGILSKRLACFALSLSLLGCIQKSYPGQTHGKEEIATLQFELGGAKDAQIEVNGSKIEQGQKASVLEGAVNIRMRYRIARMNTGNDNTTQTGNCLLKFNAIKKGLYSLSFAIARQGTDSIPHQATLTVRRLNTDPTLVFGSFDSVATTRCEAD